MLKLHFLCRKHKDFYKYIHHHIVLRFRKHGSKLNVLTKKKGLNNDWESDVMKCDKKIQSLKSQDLENVYGQGN